MNEIDHWLSTDTIKVQAQKVLNLALSGKTHFNVHLEKLDAVADFVTEVTRKRYPDLNIPFHARMSHFQVGGVDRVSELKKALSGLSKEEQIQAQIDLVVVSVLLDAGAGARWTFNESESGQIFSRSEGLAVASYRAFRAGLFSSNPDSPCEVDAEGLVRLTEEQLKSAFQVSELNPLEGFAGRLNLLRGLARTLNEARNYFGLSPRRPGALLNYFGEIAKGRKLRAAQILKTIQLSLGPIWPGRVSLHGVNLGDVWSYPPLGESEYIPFHKLSQWLSYSLVGPLTEYGFEVSGFDEMTALAEYRNGGLLLDMGALTLKDAALASVAHAASSEIIVEWRALTVSLFESLADKVRARLQKSEVELPLGKILEGGTWAAGREIAAKLRADASPPLKLQSDGTVF